MCHLSAQPHTNIHTHMHTSTHVQHKMQLSVQRCAILTEYVKRCAILALSHTQTYTHICIQVHTHTRGVGTGGATGARAPLVLQQAKLTYKAYVGQSLRDPVGSADHMAQGVRDAIGIATQYSYIIVRHYLEL